MPKWYADAFCMLNAKTGAGKEIQKGKQWVDFFADFL
jgi:hypothetical protein